MLWRGSAALAPPLGGAGKNRWFLTERALSAPVFAPEHLSQRERQEKYGSSRLRWGLAMTQITKNAPPSMGGAKIMQLDLGNLDLDLVAQGVGLDDAVNDSLVVQDLAGGNGSGAAVLHSVHEGAQLLVEQVAGRI